MARYRTPGLMPTGQAVGESTFTYPEYGMNYGLPSGGEGIPIGETYESPGLDPGGGGYIDPGNLPPVSNPFQPLGSFAGSLSGFDMNKFDGQDESEKYQLGRVFSQFDPKAGITPDLLSALNALNIGDFSGSGDQLTVQNARNGARWLSGTGDVVQNFTGDGPANWTYLDTSPAMVPGIPNLGGFSGTSSGPDGTINAWSAGGGANPLSSPNASNRQDIWSILTGLLNQGDGGMNQSILTRRVESAREDMNRSRQSQTDQYRALLADRGLVGSGGETSAAGRLEQDLANTFAGAERDIYADEAGRADDRLMQALSLATGMTMDDARNEIERYKADVTRELGLGNISLGRDRLGLDRELGLGGLGLQNLGLENDWNQFVARFGLDRERFAHEQETGNFDQLARILDLIMRGSQTGAGGYV